MEKDLILFYPIIQRYLNSGSTLRYPIKFIDNQIREVFLREAFFEYQKMKKIFFVLIQMELM